MEQTQREAELADAYVRIDELQTMVDEATDIGLKTLEQLEVRDAERDALARIRNAGGTRSPGASRHPRSDSVAGSVGVDSKGTTSPYTGAEREHAVPEVAAQFIDMAKAVIERYRFSGGLAINSEGVLIEKMALAFQSAGGNDPNWTGKVVWHCVESIREALVECSGGKFTLQNILNEKTGANVVHVIEPKAIRDVISVPTDIAVMGG